MFLASEQDEKISQRVYGCSESHPIIKNPVSLTCEHVYKLIAP